MDHLEPLVSLGPLPGGTNPYLLGNYAPVRSEAHIDAIMAVDGAIPPALSGTLLRSGPNPAVVDDPAAYHWLTGDGMVHKIVLQGGRAVTYESRWVRTRRLAAEIGTLAPHGPLEAVDGPANSAVLAHAGRLLALCETGFPHQLDAQLATLGIWDADAMLASPMCAHPVVDPSSGGVAFFGIDVFGPPFLRYHELDAAGELVHSTDVALPRATYQHAAGVTATRIVFLDLPAVFDPDRAAHPSFPFAWQPDAGARLGVLGRGRPGTQTAWVDLAPCFAFHIMNAFDDGPGVVLDVCRYDSAFDTPPGGLLTAGPATLERWRVEPGRAVDVRRIDDRPVELPRSDPACAGLPYRYGYALEIARVGGPSTGRTPAGAAVGRPAGGFEAPVALLQYDLVRDHVVRRELPPGVQPGEPLFVRAPDGRADDEGWVLCLLYDAARGASDLLILDATAFGGPPEAVVHLPRRIPFGFHGTWIPAP